MHSTSHRPQPLDLVATLAAPLWLDGLAGVTTVVVGPRATESALAATAAVDTGVVGIHEPGTALRMDDVALPMFAAITGPPATVDIVTALAGRLAHVTIARVAENRQ